MKLDELTPSLDKKSDSLNKTFKKHNDIEFFIYYKDRLKVYEKEIVKFNKTFQKEDNNIIDDAIDKFAAINKGGKYLRGCLIDLGYKLNKKDEYATPLAIAYETFQTAILVHDDIIDNAILRRGKETIHYTYQKEFEKLKPQLL